MQINQPNENIESINNIGNFAPTQSSNEKKKNTMLMAVLGLVFAGLVIVAYLYVNKNGTDSLLKPTGDDAVVDGKVPEGKYLSPLTGELYDAETEAEVRPLGVMINNHFDARPQSGLIDADLVYEVVAEGGITRFLAFFNSKVPEKIGPVRSIREYYLVLVKELGDAMVMHIGWSPQALTAIETWPIRSLGRGGGQFWRDQERLDAGVATEHTAYVNGKDLLELGDTLGWEGTRDFDTYEFKEDAKIVAKTGDTDCMVGDCAPIAIDFWHKGDYSAIWDYDRETNTYLRSMGYDENDKPIPHVDQDSGERLSVKNLIVQFATEISIVGDDKGRLDYELIGSGEGIVFTDGEAIDVTWSKESKEARTLFFNSTTGEEVAFNRGKFWISIVPDRNVTQVVY